MKRYFNTSGPNRLKEHYTLMRPDLVKTGLDLVKNERYFTIWAPRQTGKSTCFLLLKNALEKENYKVIHINLENYLGAPLKSLMNTLRFNFKKIGISIEALGSFADFFNIIQATQDIRLVLIIDEIEGLNPKLFGQFLHTLRNLYHFREQHCLKSVMLVGVSNIVGVVEDNASPFNIADNINVPFFSTKETFELLKQHETETGQLFAPKVKEKISHITANQPGLVNAFAYHLVKRYEQAKLISMDNYMEVEDWFIKEAIDKNVANIVNKAKKYRSFVERLLFMESKIPFIIDRESTKSLFTNGLIGRDKEGNIIFKVPLYKKRLYNAFYPYMNGENTRIRRELWIPDYFDSKGELNFEKLIANYKAYVQRRGFRYFREKDPITKEYLSLKETAVVYSFETYIQAFLQEAGGRSYLEAHVGLGRMDLLLFLKNKTYVIEFKVYSSPSKFLSGKKQLAYYCQKEGLTKGFYLVFLANNINLPKVIVEDVEMIEGVEIITYLVEYDEERDF